MPIRKIARIVDAAYKDADLARKTWHSPEFRKAVTKDRRTALSEFTTVKHALRDRERIAAADTGSTSTRGHRQAASVTKKKPAAKAAARSKKK